MPALEGAAAALNSEKMFLAMVITVSLGLSSGGLPGWRMLEGNDAHNLGRCSRPRSSHYQTRLNSRQSASSYETHNTLWIGKRGVGLVCQKKKKASHVM